MPAPGLLVLAGWKEGRKGRILLTSIQQTRFAPTSNAETLLSLAEALDRSGEGGFLPCFPCVYLHTGAPSPG